MPLGLPKILNRTLSYNGSWKSNLDSAHSTVGSSILLTRTTRCFTPAVFANIACSLQAQSESLVIHNNSDHIMLYGYTVKDNSTNSWSTKFFSLEDIFVTHCECSLYMQTFTAFLPCLSSFFKSSFKFSFPGRNHLRKNHQIPMPHIKNDTCMKIKSTRCVFCRSKLYVGNNF